MSRYTGLVAVVSIVCVVCSSLGIQAARAGQSVEKPTYYANYAEAMTAAEDQGKMLFIFFYQSGNGEVRDYFESKILQAAPVQQKLADYVCARLPIDTKIRVKGEEVSVLGAAAFEAMEGKQGIAILDFAHPQAKYYGCTVSALPLAAKHCFSVRQMRVILDLPPGTPDERMDTLLARLDSPEPAVTVRKKTARKKARTRNRTKAEPQSGQLAWHTDYARAMERAERQGKMMLVYFFDPREHELRDRFESESLADAAVRRKLETYVRVKIPIDTRIVIDGKKVTLIEHGAFSEMLGNQGVAILDFVDKNSGRHGDVVSAFPLTKRYNYSVDQTKVILDLPPGTLTQRTLIFAVRTHPDRPESTDGETNPILIEEAKLHSRHQARIRLQGHHQWDTRFRRIIARLPGGLTASEVCAESWAGEDLLQAAIECVRCWRLSSGHWSAVRAHHRYYGYDMKRGSNGIWYATGIFGKR